MSTEIEAIFSSWSLPPGLTIAIVCVSAVYIRGWYGIRKTRSAYFTGARLACFLSGMAVLWLAIASPVDGFADV
ncbi:MAG TPA: cytochrome c oxidase assembly protein, partial [Acidobacteriaceae bacterium]